MTSVARINVTHIDSFYDSIAVDGDLVVTGEVSSTKVPAFSKWFNAAGLGYLYSGTATQNANYWSGGAVGTVHIPIDIPVGFRITTIKVRYKRNSGTLVFELYKFSYGAADGAAIATASVNSGTADAEVTLSAINHTVLADRAYLLQASMGDAADRLYGITVTYDKVA